MTYVGGTRERLIHDSLFYRVQHGLSALGWFNANPTGYTQPVNMIAEQVEWDVEIALNSVTVTLEGVMGEDFELGLDSSRNEHTFFIDVYGENEALGRQLSGDIRDLLRGKFISLQDAFGIFYSQPRLDVYDWSQPTPSWIFFTDIEEVRRDRVNNFSHHWQRYMFTVSGHICDYYGDSGDTAAYGAVG